MQVHHLNIAEHNFLYHSSYIRTKLLKACYNTLRNVAKMLKIAKLAL